ncbi:hypothetical protein WKI68_16030 [Streptomyces sp. MS1.HAVA.3]|uniref:Uncharacterized protein n=1 Tax=Streptomyces caledonius TaxID=3134107 RepID=A0ABU8U3R0_9ACTN
MDLPLHVAVVPPGAGLFQRAAAVPDGQFQQVLGLPQVHRVALVGVPQPEPGGQPQQPVRGAGVGLRDGHPALAQDPHGGPGEPPPVGGPRPFQEYVAPLGQQFPEGLPVPGDQPPGPAVRLGRVLQRHRVAVPRVPFPVHPRQAHQGGHPKLRIPTGLLQGRGQLPGALLQPPGQVPQRVGQLHPHLRAAGAGGRGGRGHGQAGRGLFGQGGALGRVRGTGQQGQQDAAQGQVQLGVRLGALLRFVDGVPAGCGARQGFEGRAGLAQCARVVAQPAQPDQGLGPPHRAVPPQFRVRRGSRRRELPVRRGQQLRVRAGGQRPFVQHPAEHRPRRRRPQPGHRPLRLGEELGFPLGRPEPQQRPRQFGLRLLRGVGGPCRGRHRAPQHRHRLVQRPRTPVPSASASASRARAVRTAPALPGAGAAACLRTAGPSCGIPGR